MASPRESNSYLTWISSILRAGEKMATLQWLRLYLPDGRNFQVDLSSAMPVAFAQPMSPNDMIASIEAHPQAAPADWVDALRAAGVEVKVTGPGQFFGRVALATLALVAVIAVIVVLVN